MEIIVGLIIGAVLGVVIGLLVCRGKISALLERCNNLEQKAVEESARASKESERLQQEHERANAEQQKRFDETIAKVSAQLKVTTDEMLKQRQKEFAESNGANMTQIVNPLKETIEKMKQAMTDHSKEQHGLGEVLKKELEDAKTLSENAKKSAEELSRVFKHGSKVQGDWGETVLNELLESQGLKEGVHYDTQETIRDAQGKTVRSEDGNLMRPDVILHLDKNREVVIDSKVSLTAFMDYANAENDVDRERFLKAHLDSLTQHVKELSKKDYSSYIRLPKEKMDYVIMFVPHSGALWTALNKEPNLWRDAMEKNVFIADEQTLYAALRIVSLTWRQIAQAQNHAEVFDLANEMLDRVGVFYKKYEAIGEALGKAQKAYDEGGKKFEDRGQSILQTCHKLEKLGAKQSDKNPLPRLNGDGEVNAIEG